jgi:hypothetical protein
MPFFEEDISKEKQEKKEKPAIEIINEKLDGEDIPAEFKGKTVKDVLSETQKLRLYEKALIALGQYQQEKQKQTQLEEKVEYNPEKILDENFGSSEITQAIADYTTQRLAPIAIPWMTRQAVEYIERAASEYESKWGKEVVGEWTKEISTKLKSEIQNNPAYIQNPNIINLIDLAFKTEFSSKADTIFQKYQDEKQKKQAEEEEEVSVKMGGSMLTGGLPPSGLQARKPRFTAEDMAVYNRFRINPDDLPEEFASGPVVVDDFITWYKSKQKK